MADSSEEKMYFHNLLFLAVILIHFFGGLVIHLFIIVNNVNDWWKGRSVTSIDHIITSLGISRLCAQCANAIYVFVNIYFLSNLHSYVTIVILLRVYDLYFYSNIWLTTLLSIVFCLKISNLRSRLFLYLRRMILPRTGHFIVASGLLAAVSCLMTLLAPHSKVPNVETYNTTMKNQDMVCSYTNSIINFTMGTSIPLLFYFISSIILFSSLYHHTVKMKNSNLSINLETFYSAMKLVSVTFTYNTTFFTGYLFCVFYDNLYCISLKWPYIVLELLPTLHSSYLIYRTAKLRSQLSKVLQNVTDVIFQKKDTEISSSSRR